MEPSIEAIQHHATTLAGKRLPKDTLPELIASKDILILHFLRHLGCMFCKGQVDELQRLKQENPRFPDIIFVHHDTPERGEAFFAHHYPGAMHISDPELELYRLFGIRRLGGLQLLNPLMILKGIWLGLKGYRNITKGHRHIMQLSGTFLFFRGKLAWSHRAKYAGDQPNFRKLAK
ncbi:MAG: hypothetical protein LW884_01770 [Bacteroidetes bacterium]|jgi:hypothetical protein|nr:hypothetical protein [Bacteroidota bacterium]